MAKVQIIDVDALIAQKDEKFVTWNGLEHPVLGLTGRSYLGFISLRKKLALAQEKKDDEGQFNSTVDLVCLLVPSLQADRDKLMGLDMSVITALMNAVTSAFLESETGATPTSGDETVDVGESTGPE